MTFHGDLVSQQTVLGVLEILIAADEGDILMPQGDEVLRGVHGGGGIVHVPFMVYVLNFPVHVAIATSTCILAVSSLAGLVSHAMLGHIVWTSGLAIGAGAFVGAQGGVALAQRLQSGILMKLASVLVLITGIKFLLDAL